MMNLIEDLQWRGLINQSTDLESLKQHLDSGVCTVYSGFDPTADSLHVGHLVPLLMLKRFQDYGHRPVVLVGGATGMIGDPSFKATERSLNTAQTVQEWTEKLQQQTSQFVRFDDSETSALAVNNYDWTSSLNVIEFLRDIGKHFSVNMMMNRESVKQRLSREDQGISFTEFSYTLLQGLDYKVLNEQHNCTLQIGGSDQWGNIISGVELTRRMNNNQVHALTLPLVTKSDGTKFGKTESGAVWLSANKTSPYAFYQFWLNVEDSKVEEYLKLFTFLSPEVIMGIMAKQQGEPHLRHGQKALANAMTELVHGAEALESAQRITHALFKGNLSDLDSADIAQLKQDGMPYKKLSQSSCTLLQGLVEAEIAPSNNEGRKLIKGNAIALNGDKTTDFEHSLDASNTLHGVHVIKKGKKHWFMLELGK
ncbi:MAG: tyrosine--tRNA ligase [Magnetococcales bacterium]|nr:tyrosine--tRNA ligase [Magnetococcales bacterium]MAF32222.1 tyrosine--tRNA ligase [Magnetococcales bacterium]|tara:strand:- start:3206 stop:4477 length:1272 start_codon:yes stop_codon:yes gene_type:complete